MAKSAEKLIILNDIASGLLARFYNIVEFKRPEFFGGELDKFFKALVKPFPEFPPNLTKEKGYEVFTKRATEIATSLRDYYLTFLDLLSFTDEATKLLHDLAKTFIDLKFDLNVDLMTYFMNLLVKFAQLHVLVSMAPEPKLMLSAYAKAYHITAANTEPNFLKIAAYLKTYAAPLKYMQENFGDLAKRVGETLMTLQMPVLSWAESKTMMDKKVFGIIEDVKNMGLPSNEKAHLELLHLDRFKTWCMWGFMVCPGGLARPGALDLIKQVLKDSFVIQVYRDKTLNVHAEFEALGKWFKLKEGAPEGKFSMKKSATKKYFTDAVEDWQWTVRSHHELRVYLRNELTTLGNFFAEAPGAIAPKIQMIFACLHLAREEVLWYFRHLTAKPHKQSKYQPVVDGHISDLIHLIHRLAELVSRNKASIKQYYLEYITGADGDRVAPEIERFLAANRGVAQPVITMLRMIADGVKGLKADANFEAIRLTWYRVSASLNNTMAGVSMPAAAALHQAMGHLVTHSRNVDCVSSQLRAHASFQELFWYRVPLFDLLKDCLKATGGQAAHCMSFVKILNNALHNVHRICPEEQTAIGKEAVTMADTFLRTIVIGVEILLKTIVQKTKQLRSQTKPTKVAQRMQQQQEFAAEDAKLAAAGKPALGERKQPLPGQESWLVNRRQKDVEQMYQWRKSISEICGAIFKHDRVNVYNIEFVPKEYLYESMQHNIRTTLKGLALKDKGIIERPTLILSGFRDVLYAYQTVESYVNINLSDIVRDVMLSEFTDEAHGSAGDPVVTGREANSETPATPSTPTAGGSDKKEPVEPAGPIIQGTGIIHQIAQWYCQLFSRDIGVDLGISFSPVKKSFVSRPVAAKPGATPEIILDAEWYTDVNELRALATLAGPYGMRVLDRGLLTIVSKHVGLIRDVMVRNQAWLQAILGRFTEWQLWSDTVAKLSNMNELLTHATIVGCVLQFRNLLREALNDVVSEKAPFIISSVKLAHQHFHDAADVDPGHASIDYLAQDCGLGVGEADHSLRLCLQKYKTQLSDVLTWNLIPEMFGMSYISPRWSTALYQIANEGHTNNIHTVAETIKVLLVAFQRMPLKQELNKAEVTLRIQADFDRFIRISSYTVLHMCSKQCMVQYPVSTIMLFLEQFILASGGRLTLSVLEECFPFTLVRTKYIQVYQQQSIASVDDEEKKDAPAATPAAAATPAPGSPAPAVQRAGSVISVSPGAPTTGAPATPGTPKQ